MGQVVLTLAVALAACGRVGFDARPDVVADASSIVDTAPGDPSLIAHYACDDGAGGTRDEAATVGDATCAAASCPTRVPGIRGDACLFDGIDDVLEVAHVPALETTGGLTAAAWIRPTVTNRHQSVVSKPIGTSFRNAWQFVVDTGGVVLICATASANGPGDCDTTSPGTVAAGVWTHIAYTWDGTVHRGWVNGVSVVDQPIGVGFDDRAFLIGADIDDGLLVNAFLGAIDDVRIYRRALTPAEIQVLATP